MNRLDDLVRMQEIALLNFAHADETGERRIHAEMADYLTSRIVAMRQPRIAFRR